jgi:class 3 adenylate cyclase
LISKDAYERVKNQINAKPYAPLTVKGKTQPIEVYEVMGLK